MCLKSSQAYYSARQAEVECSGNRGGIYNDGYDDESYNYIFKQHEIVADRYVLKYRIGQVTFRLFMRNIFLPFFSGIILSSICCI